MVQVENNFSSLGVVGYGPQGMRLDDSNNQYFFIASSTNTKDEFFLSARIYDTSGLLNSCPNTIDLRSYEILGLRIELIELYLYSGLEYVYFKDITESAFYLQTMSTQLGGAAATLKKVVFNKSMSSFNMDSHMSFVVMGKPTSG